MIYFEFSLMYAIPCSCNHISNWSFFDKYHRLCDRNVTLFCNGLLRTASQVFLWWLTDYNIIPILDYNIIPILFKTPVSTYIKLLVVSLLHLVMFSFCHFPLSHESCCLVMYRLLYCIFCDKRCFVTFKNILSD